MGLYRSQDLHKKCDLFLGNYRAVILIFHGPSPPWCLKLFVINYVFIVVKGSTWETQVKTKNDNLNSCNNCNLSMN